jgi:ABC-type glutathione transport system ATPase component
VLLGTFLIVVGASGSGKSVIMDYLLKQEKNKSHLRLSFTTRTPPDTVQNVLEHSLQVQRRKGQVFLMPAKNQESVMMVDDINMPKIENNRQECNELLRQLLEQKGIYDRKEFFFKTVENVVVAGLCCPPGGARSELSHRLLGQLSLF